MHKQNIKIEGNNITIKKNLMEENDFVISIVSDQSDLGSTIDKNSLTNNFVITSIIKYENDNNSGKHENNINEENFYKYWKCKIIKELNNIKEEDIKNIEAFLKKATQKYKDQITIHPIDIIEKDNDIFGRIIIWNGSDRFFSMDSIPIKINDLDGINNYSKIFECEILVNSKEFRVIYVNIDDDSIINKKNSLDNYRISF